MKQRYKYILWVGGIDEEYNTLIEAEEAKQKYISKGYDDIQIEEIETRMKPTTYCLSWGDNHKLYRSDLSYLQFLAHQKSFYFSNVTISIKRAQ